MRQLPQTIYPLSGPDIAQKLKARRAQLPEFAEQYFYYINHEVAITGSADDDLFEVSRDSDTSTTVNIYKITNKGKVKNNPFYSRTFLNDQTKEIRLFGIDGNDSFKITGHVDKGIKLRLIGGPKMDVYLDESGTRKNAKRTLIYDNYDNEITKSSETKLHLSNDDAVHAYQYDFFKANKHSKHPILFYNQDDRIHVGVGYLYQKQQWRKEPFGQEHKVDLKYSIEQHAFSATYSSYFPMLLGKWDLFTYLNYDFIRWNNFYGLGNETPHPTGNSDFNRVRSRQGMVLSLIHI